MRSSHTLDQLDTCFDDTHAIANAGLLLVAKSLHRTLLVATQNLLPSGAAITTQCGAGWLWGTVMASRQRKRASG